MARSFLVTGGAGGIGLEVARQLRARGDRVIVAARAERMEALRADLGADVETVSVDFASLASVRTAAAAIRELAPKLDVLINNAGVVETKRKIAADGHETTWTVNVLAPFLLTELLLPALEAGDAPRVVNVGSTAHRSGKLDLDDVDFATRRYGGWAAYAQSKLALMMLTREFAKRYPAVAFDCVHPGGIATGIYRNVPGLLRGLILRVLPPAAAGAVPVVSVALSETPPAASGRYFDQRKEAPPNPAALDEATAARLFDRLATVVGTAAANPATA